MLNDSGLSDAGIGLLTLIVDFQLEQGEGPDFQQLEALSNLDSDGLFTLLGELTGELSAYPEKLVRDSLARDHAGSTWAGTLEINPANRPRALELAVAARTARIGSGRRSRRSPLAGRSISC